MIFEKQIGPHVVFEPRREQRSKPGDGWTDARWSERHADALVACAKSFTYAQNRSPVAFRNEPPSLVNLPGPQMISSTQFQPCCDRVNGSDKESLHRFRTFCANQADI
jgi:hypothetical protein